MQVPTKPQGGFRLPLATSIFLLFAVLIGLALGAAVFITYRQGEKLAEEAVQQALNASAEVQAELNQRRLEEIELKVQLIAADSSFVKYVSDAQGADLGLGTETPIDAASIVDLLRERQESFRFDLGLVLDPEGNVLARSDQSEAFDTSLKGEPFVEAALREATPISGYWRQGPKLYQAALWPLAQDQDLVGFLLVALEVNNSLGASVGKASGADIAFLLPSADKVAVIGTSLDAANAAALDQAIVAGAGGITAAIQEGKPIERVSLNFGGQNWVGRLNPVDAAGGSRLGSTLQLTSADRAAAGFREILNLLSLAGLASLLVALPLSFLLAKATLRPLKTMAKAAQDAAAGSYQTRIGIRGKDELAQLSQAFDSLLSDLREKSDIEGYVTNLSRFLPDPGQERDVPSFVTQRAGDPLALPPPAAVMPVAAAAPKRETLLLLGLDLRQFARPVEGQSADAAFGQVSERTAALIGLARRHGGRLLASTGTRVMLGFAGDHRLLGALYASRDAMMVDSGIAAAMIEGEVVHGTVIAGHTSALAAVGAVCYQLDRLLGESGPGKVLLPRALGEATKTIAGAEAVTVVTGLVSAKSFYAVAANALGALPPAPPAPKVDDGVATIRSASVPVASITTPRPGRVSEPQPGMRFGGRYEILSVLGSGGMGVVYKARDIELDDVVALKMLKPNTMLDFETMERLKSEIKLARKITHPNVLRTFDLGEVDGRPYVSMEYVRGMTLRYLLKQAGRIPYSAALRIARQLCAGLGAAHEVGVLHRDVKPENLILESSGNAKLMDFGIARPIRRSEPGQTQPGMFVGTPHYSSPEQLAGEDVDNRSDIYSSGVLMCEMFCGKLPFTGVNTMEIYLAQMQQQPLRPSDHWPEIPKPLELVILKCIERRADDRYQSVADLGAALAALRA